MFYRLRNTWEKARFDWLTRKILNTPSIQIVDAPWSIISMVSNSDVQMYLLSIKSLYARLTRGKIIAIIDRDMPHRLRSLMQRHVIGIQFAILEDIDTGVCQRGGTWERLVYMLEHARHEYAIQVDSDTLAFGPDLDEIVQCAEANRAFTLSAAGAPVRTMHEYADDAHKRDQRKPEQRYIGNVTESMFDQYPDCDRLRYVRGSSGFAGFAVGGFSRSQLEKFHENMRASLGDAWKKWGTEQCGSNFAVANSPNPMVLPYPKYANFSPELQPGQNAFFHFFGTHRYDDDIFAGKAYQVIDELGQ